VLQAQVEALGPSAAALAAPPGAASANGGAGATGLPALADSYPFSRHDRPRLDAAGAPADTGSLQGPLKVFSGTANPGLAAEIGAHLGLDLGGILIKQFADGELYVQLQESIRGCDVFLVQPSCPPTNSSLMELLIMIDACKRASARNITAVLPYYGYARADRKASGRESITAKLVANLVTEAGADRVLILDLHSLQCVGYFDIPVDHVFGQPVLLDYLASKRIPR